MSHIPPTEVIAHITDVRLILPGLDCLAKAYNVKTGVISLWIETWFDTSTRYEGTSYKTVMPINLQGNFV